MDDLKGDLAFVRSVVDSSRRALSLDVVPLLLWGGLTLAGVVLASFWATLDSVWLWVGVIGLAWLLTGLRVVLAGQANAPVSFAQRALATLWFGLLTCMTVIGFAGAFSGALPTAVITPVVAAVFGAGYLASSALLQWRGLAVLALGWWLGSLALFLLPAEQRLVVFGALVLLLLMIPALLFRHFKSRS